MHVICDVAKDWPRAHMSPGRSPRQRWCATDGILFNRGHLRRQGAQRSQGGAQEQERRTARGCQRKQFLTPGIWRCVSFWGRLCLNVHVCMHQYLRTYIQKHVNIYIYIHACVCMYVCIHMHACIHKYMYTYIYRVCAQDYPNGYSGFLSDVDEAATACRMFEDTNNSDPLKRYVILLRSRVPWIYSLYPRNAYYVWNIVIVWCVEYHAVHKIAYKRKQCVKTNICEIKLLCMPFEMHFPLKHSDLTSLLNFLTN